MATLIMRSNQEQLDRSELNLPLQSSAAHHLHNVSSLKKQRDACTPVRQFIPPVHSAFLPATPIASISLTGLTGTHPLE